MHQEKREKSDLNKIRYQRGDITTDQKQKIS